MDSIHPILAVGHSLLAASVVLLTAFGYGRALVRALRLGDDDPLEVIVWSLTLGLLAGGTALFVAGLAGELHPGAVAALTLAGSLLAAAELMCAYLAWSAGHLVDVPRAAVTAHSSPDARHETRAMLLLASIVLASTFVSALAPPTSPWALSHSLEIPKTAWLDGAIHAGSPRPMPGVVHMWYLWAMALDGPVAANLIAWTSGVLMALATLLVARPLVGVRRAPLAGAVALVCPGVQYQMSVPAEDLAAALFGALAAGVVVDVARGRNVGHWRLCVGLMLGGLIAGTWLAGDPARVERPLLAHLGPVAVVGLAGGAVLMPRGRVLRVMATVAALLAAAALGRVAWSLLIPPAAIGAVWTWHEIERFPRPARVVAWCAWGALMLAAPLASAAGAIDKGAVAIGWQSRHEFLLARVPNYRAASMIRRIGRRGERLFCQDRRTLYFPCLTELSSHELALSGNSTDGALAGDSIAAARAAGCTYLLLAQSNAPASVEPGTAIVGAGLGEQPEDVTHAMPAIGQVMPILEYRIADDNNRFIRYRLLRLR